MFTTVIIALTIIVLLIASYCDLRTKEVPDYLSYLVIAIAIVVRVLWFISDKAPKIIFWVPISFSILFIFSYLMYKAGQWGGGDVKVMMGLSILLAWFPARETPFFIDFFLNSLVVGAFYGMFAVIVTGIVNIKEFKKYLNKIDYVMIPTLLILTVILFKTLPFIFAFLASLVIVSIGLFKYFKVIETNFLHKKVPIPKLTEGDWLLNDIKIKGRVIVPKREIGLIEDDLKKLMALYKRKKIKKVEIKVGIPFVPAFLISFMFTVFYGNILLKMIQLSLGFI